MNNMSELVFMIFIVDTINLLIYLVYLRRFACWHTERVSLKILRTGNQSQETYSIVITCHIPVQWFLQVISRSSECRRIVDIYPSNKNSHA